MTPNGSRVYVTNQFSNSVSVIDAGSVVNTATDQFEGSFSVGLAPIGVAVTPDGSRILVANAVSDDVSVIDSSTKRELTRVSADKPIAFGQFIADVPN